MSEPILIKPMLTLDLDAILPLVAGYTSDEKYAIEKTESEACTTFIIRLVKLGQAYRATFTEDFNDKDSRRYRDYLLQGYSFGAYQGDRLVGMAIGEAIPRSQINQRVVLHLRSKRREEAEQASGRQSARRCPVWPNYQSFNTSSMNISTRLGSKCSPACSRR